MARIWKFGSDVDTDQIVPGRYAPYMRPNEDVANAAFIEAHPEFNINAVPGDIIVAENNFGCGSSREYAPLSLKRREIGAIIANSFARIFYRNAINLGIPIFITPEIVNSLSDGSNVTLDIDNARIYNDQIELDLPPLPNFAVEIIQSGGIVQYFCKHGYFPGEGN
jgi:methanogen homoaconitase small subunit